MVGMNRAGPAPVLLLIAALHAPVGAQSEFVDASDAPFEADRTSEIDAAVRRGLAWLARHQLPHGGWDGEVGHKRGDGYIVLDPTRHGHEGEGHPGVTSLAGLAFLADGHVPDRGPHRDVLNHTIDYLLRKQNDAGFITDNESRMYSHAFATLFLSQVHGMSESRRLVADEALRKAVRFVEETQNRFGGWRYSPFTEETDLSVTVCQVQALRAARNIGIRVNKSGIDRVIDYVERSRIDSGPYAGAFYYKIHGRAAYTKTSYAINAAAATSLHSAGVYDSQRYGGALDYLEENYDELSRFYPYHYYFWYGNYYAAQAFHLEGGRRWERYWKRLRDDLLARQEPDGRWINSVGPGDVFSTAVATLLLRIPAEYLPIFQK